MGPTLADHIVAFGFNCSSMDAFSKTLYFEEASYGGIELFNLPAFISKASFCFKFNNLIEGYEFIYWFSFLFFSSYKLFFQIKFLWSSTGHVGSQVTTMGYFSTLCITSSLGLRNNYNWRWGRCKNYVFFMLLSRGFKVELMGCLVPRMWILRWSLILQGNIMRILILVRYLCTKWYIP